VVACSSCRGLALLRLLSCSGGRRYRLFLLPALLLGMSCGRGVLRLLCIVWCFLCWVRLACAVSVFGLSCWGLGDGWRLRVLALSLSLALLLMCSRQAMDGDLFSHMDVREQGRPRHG